ncbi:MAG: glucose-6-phosphate isomerase [Phycisphaerales bacterium]|nr:glucose-6-phosphate isomerase [Phycisphaerales bacterium]
MLPRQNPTTTVAWHLLAKHYLSLRQHTLVDLFQQDPNRFDKLSYRIEKMVVDFSKNYLTQETIDCFVKLARTLNLNQSIEALFNGTRINETEDRAVLHTALRDLSNTKILVDGNDIRPDIARVKKQMKQFTHKVHSGTWLGYTKKKIKYIVNIGIGGSDLGPQMVTEALKPFMQKGITSYFVSNVDGYHLSQVLEHVKPAETLFIIASKTFTTQETMTNAYSARSWFLQHAHNEKHIVKHFVAISTNKQEVVKFGIAPDNMFVFWDWVGGRFSLWSAIGLSIALSIGYKNFEELLSGAYVADKHFRFTPFEHNIPFLMAMISLSYTHFCGATAEVVIPYSQLLHRLTPYLQQACMESNGKSVARDGTPVHYPTSGVIWGEPGTNGQHAFFQMLHQGTSLIPADFIAVVKSHNSLQHHQPILLSNFFAQTEALMTGKSEAVVRAELEKQGLAELMIQKLLPHKVFKGNHPSTSFLIEDLTPKNLGVLIALYEHKIFVQGCVLNIFSFDQWGVELGKQLANKILPELLSAKPVRTHDSSTNGLIQTYKKMRK